MRIQKWCLYIVAFVFFLNIPFFSMVANAEEVNVIDTMDKLIQYFCSDDWDKHGLEEIAISVGMNAIEPIIKNTSDRILRYTWEDRILLSIKDSEEFSEVEKLNLDIMGEVAVVQEKKIIFNQDLLSFICWRLDQLAERSSEAVVNSVITWKAWKAGNTKIVIRANEEMAPFHNGSIWMIIQRNNP